MPSVTPTTKTASHSRPLAACSEASVTPSTRRGVLRLGPLVELGDEVGQRRVTAGAAARSSASRASAASDSQRSRTAPAPSGGVADQPPPESTRPHRRPAGRRPPSAERAAPRSSSRASRTSGAVEEPLAAAQDVGHAGVGQRLLVGLALPVGAEQHGHLAGRRARGDQRLDAGRDPARLGRLVGELAQLGGRAGGSLRHQLEPAVPPGRRSRRRCGSPARPPAASSGSRGPAAPPGAPSWRSRKPSRKSGEAPAKV